VVAVQGEGEIPQFNIKQSLSGSASLLEIVSTLRRKDERMKEVMEELWKLDMIVEVQKELAKLEALCNMKEGFIKMKKGSELKRKRKLSKCTENVIKEVVYVEEDQKVDISEELEQQTGSAQTDFVSEVKVNIVSHLGEEKKVISESKSSLGGKTIQCPPANMRKKVSDLRKQEVIIKEKEVELRKIVKRREKIEEKERDCLAEMKDVRKKLEILKRDSEHQKRCSEHQKRC